MVYTEKSLSIVIYYYFQQGEQEPGSVHAEILYSVQKIILTARTPAEELTKLFSQTLTSRTDDLYNV